jgi:hypothetical protein
MNAWAREKEANCAGVALAVRSMRMQSAKRRRATVRTHKGSSFAFLVNEAIMEREDGMSTNASPIAETYDEWLRRPDVDAVAATCRFFMRDDPVHQTLRNIAANFDRLGIAYAVAGGMALSAHGFVRATVDVDILVTAEGLAAVHRDLEGLGYVSPFGGSKNLKDVSTGVRIEFLVAGQFPGDGKPKPVAFPDPVEAGVEIDGIRYLGLPVLVELKLASGMTGGVARLKDFADVVSLIETLHLPLEFAQRLNPYVRPKYEELWRGLQADE